MDKRSRLLSQQLENLATEKLNRMAHFPPGKPAQNALKERFNRTFREDVFDDYPFPNLNEV
jgi:hypothetical protein